MKTSRTIVFLLMCVVSLASVHVFADGARIPIYQSTTINASGHYYLTRDINSSNDPVISITSDDVTLDLNGYTISSSLNTNNLIDFTDTKNVTICNGNMSGGYQAVYNSTTTTRTRVIIKNLEIRDTNYNGIYVSQTEYIEVDSCRLINIGSKGIYLSGGTDAFSGKINNNYIETTGSDSIYITGFSASEINNNHILFSGTIGIVLWGNNSWATPSNGNIIKGNRIHKGNQQGIRLAWYTNGNQVLSNVVTDNNGVGIEVDWYGNRVAENISKDNGDHGFWCSSTGTNNLFEGNMADGNNGYGLWLNAAQYYRNNMLVGNTSGAASGGNDAGGNII